MAEYQYQREHVTPDWLKEYAAESHRWEEAQDQGAAILYRPLGIVESLFDSDGAHYEGRADINMSVAFEIKTTMSKEALRRHVLLAWANLRLRHTLLMGAAVSARGYMDESTAREHDRFFAIQRPRGYDDAVRSAQDALVFLGDYYRDVDLAELYHHAQNTARTFDAEKTLARLLVLPLEEAETDTCTLRFLFLMSHEISDGLTGSAWTIDFTRLLNQSFRALRDAIGPFASTLHERLPVPQEDLYPPIAGSRARQRWFWAITLVLRHVQKPYPEAFPNPLRRPSPRVPAEVPSTRTFTRVLDYTKPPALNSGTIRAILSKQATQRLHRACRQAGCSIGAGSFVLVALVMMEMQERRFPDVDDKQRLPFVGSFPINPRPFFAHRAAPDSVMLAFSDGVILPFMSSSLDLDARIRLLARSAQRQLSRYQKRAEGGTSIAAAVAAAGREGERARMLEYMGARGAGRVIATNYLDTIERAHDRVPGSERRRRLSYVDSLPKQGNLSLGTCGVSSVGRVSAEMRPGNYDLSRPLMRGDDGEGVLVADFRESRMNVRARDGEFLVGVWGDDDHIAANVSYDACAIDPALAELWKQRMESILEESVPSRL